MYFGVRDTKCHEIPNRVALIWRVLLSVRVGSFFTNFRQSGKILALRTKSVFWLLADNMLAVSAHADVIVNPISPSSTVNITTSHPNPDAAQKKADSGPA